MESRTRPRGEIITFYSYKGGTGRTMALANVACLLADRVGDGQTVLTIDWDLEAPGLHRFLLPRRVPQSASTDLGLDATPGLIDLFLALAEHLPPEPARSEEATDAAVRTAFSAIDFDQFVADTAVPGVRILRAGRNDDGKYSQRVSSFNWESLFNRAPTVYRALAERLSETFPYVLIDSRTGVTDISGICTSLLPEKLVVVFTPNRQSLSGVRELVQRATSYRRNSDDLRPLLVYPLPSRIEASLEDLRTLWRFGSPDRNVVGYQPMFEELFVESYALRGCDLSAYFDEVQIQQTPDYAYGEEIAVRRRTDRFSLADSYRLFVARLGSGMAPWERVGEKAVGAGESASLPQPPTPLPPSNAVPPSPSVPSSAPLSVEDGSEAQRSRIFLSYAPKDRDRVRPIAAALDAQGFDVWWEANIPSGPTFDRAVADALDGSDAVIVCWSEASLLSGSVIDQAGEGLRRGILIPVLLDDVVPPLAFRSIQSADLRRDVAGGAKKVAEAAAGIARGAPGTTTPELLAVEAVPLSPRRTGRSFALVAVTLVAAASVALLLKQTASRRSPEPGSISKPSTTVVATPVEHVRVPDFVGEQTADVRKAAEYLGLRLVFKDENGKESPSLEGVVIKQSPAAGQDLPRGSPVDLAVASATVTVPTIVGTTLDEAVLALDKRHLRLSGVTERPLPDVKPGTIIAQSPVAGAGVAEGSGVSLTIATSPRQRPTRSAPSSRP